MSAIQNYPFFNQERFFCEEIFSNTTNKTNDVTKDFFDSQSQTAPNTFFECDAFRVLPNPFFPVSPNPSDPNKPADLSNQEQHKIPHSNIAPPPLHRQKKINKHHYQILRPLIITLCKENWKVPSELAKELEITVKSITYLYLLPMAREGILETHPDTQLLAYDQQLYRMKHDQTMGKKDRINEIAERAKLNRGDHEMVKESIQQLLRERPMSIKDLANHLGRREINYLKRKLLKPMIKAGSIQLINRLYHPS